MRQRLAAVAVILLIACPAWADFDDSFTPGSQDTELGTGTGTNYSPGLWTVAKGLSIVETSGTPSLGLCVNNRGVGPTGTGTIANFTVRTGANMGAGTYQSDWASRGAWYAGWNRTFFVWNYQDETNFYFIKTTDTHDANWVYTMTLHVGYVQNGATTYIGSAMGTYTASSNANGSWADTAYISVTWDPSTDAITATVKIVDKNNNTSFDNTGSPWTGTGPDLWDSGSMGAGAGPGNGSDAYVSRMSFTATTAGGLTNVDESDVRSNSAVITFDSSALGSEQVQYGLTSSYGISTIENPSMKSAHSVTLSGLQPDTTYHYKARSKDANDVWHESSDLTFTTAPVTAMITGAGTPTGGLTTWTVPMLGPNLLANSSFETAGTGNNPANWTDNGQDNIVRDATVGHSGSCSLKLFDLNQVPMINSASQSVSMFSGSYRLSGWFKLSNLGSAGGPGIRLTTDDWGWTEILSGTMDWTYRDNICDYGTAGTRNFSVDGYGDPSGTCWVDDVEFRRLLPAGIDVYMTYPNYHGMLFSDLSQTVSFNVTVNTPNGDALNLYKVVGFVVDEASPGTVLATNTYDPPTSANFNSTFNGSSYTNGHTYLFRWQLIRKSDSMVVYEYPAYRLAKTAGTARATMNFSFDDKGCVLHYDKPVFILGVYDSGPTGSTEENWEQTLQDERNLWELCPMINWYNNAYLGEYNIDYLVNMLNVFQRHGLFNLHESNQVAEWPMPNWRIFYDDDYLSTLSAHPASMGVYVLDEGIPKHAEDVFKYTPRIKAFHPDGLIDGCAIPAPQNYRDAIDMLSMDPYWVWGDMPPGGYNMAVVADQTIQTKNAVMGSKPVYTVMQFCNGYGSAPWPTATELRNGSYMAVANGAQGLVYWSIGNGNGALHGDDLTQEQIDVKFAELKALITEVYNISDALASQDTPAKVSSCSNSNIRYRVKTYGGAVYVIASNYVNSAQSGVTFTMDGNIYDSVVYGEGRTITPSGATFTDNFGAFEAHVYRVHYGQPPAITVQPTDQTVTAPAAAAFSVTATGPSLQYQWQKNVPDSPSYVDISGATSSSYTTPATSVEDDGAVYRVKVWNSNDLLISNTATLTVHAAPSITVQPPSQTVPYGKATTLSIAAVGDAPISYQWKKNGADISGATSTSYTTPTLYLAASGDVYTCYVSNSYGNLTSNQAVVQVDSSGVSNPSFEAVGGNNLPSSWSWQSSNNAWSVNTSEHHSGAKSIQCTDPSGSTQVVLGNNSVGQLETGTYKISCWVKTVGTFGDASHYLRLDLVDDTHGWAAAALEIYGDYSTWTKKEMTCTVTEAGPFNVCLRMGGVTGTMYIDDVRCAKDTDKPSIMVQPAGAGKNVGESVTFTVAAQSNYTLSYQWKKNGANISGATSSSYTDSDVQSGDAGSYTCAVTDTNGAATTDPAVLTVSGSSPDFDDSFTAGSQSTELGTGTGVNYAAGLWTVVKDHAIVETSGTPTLGISVGNSRGVGPEGSGAIADFTVRTGASLGAGTYQSDWASRDAWYSGWGRTWFVWNYQDESNFYFVTTTDDHDANWVYTATLRVGYVQNGTIHYTGASLGTYTMSQNAIGTWADTAYISVTWNPSGDSISAGVKIVNKDGQTTFDNTSSPWTGTGPDLWDSGSMGAGAAIDAYLSRMSYSSQ